ncbi:MAG: DNA-3-methyladenine glycosylase I [Alteromonadaceae bacterium]|nr:DNA-3-methyladenine glycosylase I [Alteromonadaceae bacterium]
MSLESYQAIYARALKRKRSEGILESLLTEPLHTRQIAQIGDDRFLAEFTKKVFQSGFVWRVVRNKWPDFEEVFWGFDIEKILMMPEDMLEKKATDPRIIRNYSKVKTIKENALMIHDIAEQHGSFGEFVAQWPKNDMVGLWDYLKKHGKRLGGNTGPYALRFLGVDTFLLSKDVEDYFTQHGIITGSARSKRSLTAIQDAFLTWQQQSGRSLTELSQLVAYSCGDNYVGVQ